MTCSVPIVYYTTLTPDVISCPYLSNSDQSHCFIVLPHLDVMTLQDTSHPTILYRTVNISIVVKCELGNPQLHTNPSLVWLALQPTDRANGPTIVLSPWIYRSRNMDEICFRRNLCDVLNTRPVAAAPNVTNNYL